MFVHDFMNCCKSELTDSLADMRSKVKGSNALKAELWKGDFKGVKIDEFLGNVFRDTSFKMQLEILKFIKVIQCRSDQKNRDLFNKVISAANIKIAKWYQKFKETEGMSRLLYGMFVRSSVELEDGFMYYKDGLMTISLATVFELEFKQIKMVDVDGCTVTFYMDKEVHILKFKQSAMTKLQKWFSLNKVQSQKLTQVKKANKLEVEEIKKAINKITADENDEMPFYESLNKRKISESDKSFKYETPMKKKKVNTAHDTLVPSKFYNEESTFLNASEDFTPKQNKKMFSLQTPTVGIKTENKKDKPINTIFNQAKIVKSNIKVKPKYAELSDDYDLGNIFKRNKFDPAKSIGSTKSAASTSQEEQSCATEEFVLKEWHESMALALESFFAQKQQEMAAVKDHLEEKKNMVQEQLVASLMPSHSDKLLDIIVGDDIVKQRRKNMLQLKESVSILMETWSNF